MGRKVSFIIFDDGSLMTTFLPARPDDFSHGDCFLVDEDTKAIEIIECQGMAWNYDRFPERLKKLAQPYWSKTKTHNGQKPVPVVYYEDGKPIQ